MRRLLPRLLSPTVRSHVLTFWARSHPPCSWYPSINCVPLVVLMLCFDSSFPRHIVVLVYFRCRSRQTYTIIPSIDARFGSNHRTLVFHICNVCV
ncbi:hypothetical protein K438DRAFT_1064282 [Mycena galopus ATCC 62051]|nr:hypothetical protein K438DRAFT_1064282 [Mycena galopus ATCC 62051]